LKKNIIKNRISGLKAVPQDFRYFEPAQFFADFFIQSLINNSLVKLIYYKIIHKNLSIHFPKYDKMTHFSDLVNNSWTWSIIH